jgi:hypothetical protein
MKKLLVLATAAFLVSGVAFAHGDDNKKKCAKGKECCKKDGKEKSCHKKDGKEAAKSEKTAEAKPAAAAKKS